VLEAHRGGAAFFDLTLSHPQLLLEFALTLCRLSPGQPRIGNCLIERSEMEDLERYVEQVVDPTIKDFVDHPTSVRHAFLACVAVFHSVDYLAHRRRRAANLRQEWRKASPAFAKVDELAHAFKHVVTGSPKNPTLKATDVISRPPAIWGEMQWGLSRWDDPIGGVTVDNDRDLDILDLVKSAAQFVHRQVELQNN
jgi:hypothetical protein